MIMSTFEKVVSDDLRDIAKLLRMLTAIEAYKAGLISRNEAYSRTGIASELQGSKIGVVDLGKFEHG